MGEVERWCEFPGCAEYAMCTSGNFGGKDVCEYHFKLTNGPDPMERIAELEAALATAVEERQAAERVADAGRALYGGLAVVCKNLGLLSAARAFATADKLEALLRAYETAAASTGQAGEGAG